MLLLLLLGFFDFAIDIVNDSLEDSLIAAGTAFIILIQHVEQASATVAAIAVESVLKRQQFTAPSACQHVFFHHLPQDSLTAQLVIDAFFRVLDLIIHLRADKECG